VLAGKLKLLDSMNKLSEHIIIEHDELGTILTAELGATEGEISKVWSEIEDTLNRRGIKLVLDSISSDLNVDSMENPVITFNYESWK